MYSVPEEFRVKDDIEVQLTTVEQVQAFLSTAQDDAVKAVIKLDLEDFHSPDEKELHDLLSHLEEDGQLMPLSDDAIDKESIMSPIASSDGLPDPDDDALSDPDSENELAPPIAADSLSTPVVVMIASCALALMIVGCVALILYIAELLQIRAFESILEVFPQILDALPNKSGITTRNSFQLITDFEKVPLNDEIRPGSDDARKDPERATEIECKRTWIPEESFATGLVPLIVFGEEAQNYYSEKDYARSGSLLAHARTTPDCSPLTSDLKPSLSCDDIVVPGGLPIQELEASPLWFRRASEVSSLARPSDESERYGQFTVPGLDAALAMQLRPGFGASGDAAWLVRFVMALFGWCAVLMGGSNHTL